MGTPRHGLQHWRPHVRLYFLAANRFEAIDQFLFLAATIVRHAGAVMVRYCDHYAEQGILTRLMNLLRSIAPGDRFAPVVPMPLRI